MAASETTVTSARTARRTPRAEQIGSLLRPAQLRRELEEHGAVRAGYPLLSPQDLNRVRDIEKRVHP